MPGLAGRKPASSGLCCESLVHSPAKPPWSQLTSQVGAGCGSQVTWALPHWKVPRQPRVQRVLFCALQPKVLPCCASQARRQQKPRQGQGHRRPERSWLVVGSDQRGRAGDSRARTPQRSAGAAPCTCRAAWWTDGIAPARPGGASQSAETGPSRCRLPRQQPISMRRKQQS